MPGGSAGIGTPAEVREQLREFEAAGVDQAIFIQQGGNNRHDHICQALELFAAEVKPEFADRHAARARAKAEALAPYVERALARRREVRTPAELPPVTADGRDGVSGQSRSGSGGE